MTAQDDFQITGIKLIDAPASRIGNRLVALLDVTMAGVSIHSCALIEGPDGIARVKGPLGKTHGGTPIEVTFTDAALLRAITRKAVGLYAACSGRELTDE